VAHLADWDANYAFNGTAKYVGHSWSECRLRSSIRTLFRVDGTVGSPLHIWTWFRCLKCKEGHASDESDQRILKFVAEQWQWIVRTVVQKLLVLDGRRMSACSIRAELTVAVAAEWPSGLDRVQWTDRMGTRTGSLARFVQVLSVHSITPAHSLIHKLALRKIWYLLDRASLV